MSMIRGPITIQGARVVQSLETTGETIGTPGSIVMASDRL